MWFRLKKSLVLEKCIENEFGCKKIRSGTAIRVTTVGPPFRSDLGKVHFHFWFIKEPRGGSWIEIKVNPNLIKLPGMCVKDDYGVVYCAKKEIFLSVVTTDGVESDEILFCPSCGKRLRAQDWTPPLQNFIIK
ncbi:MAG: hypothetical protein AUJ32_01770 [Parcubacteria group bacterium CG1_02_40_82]|uniref:Uncharacterized protein n=4 Tax=Candidatus Portnoyibacteriota TaxID=1817913 RepID=A0A2M7IIY3_9BACT|nr:MAG: hypothetical protein AUJ32_01770 [Parcubacteria group bacterium CG1_02_40_82]PIQ75244.1 MAG: hypothetical protein COV84_02280 [Candidatus Portnoybacteria bacterium CG11_big_fil_rev_8_21_14_0_20_40_15]PIS31888.1 MAG: hypothetical protein COT41_00570 [Candidatus Portnoybacteria bacterium CG08_land_8_20_14_0_20_40_83]PIW76441.1 MAG: hypothetical protein CO001_01385 [Candidatus Portnoybacteria bacterium CG_4_8_14_3_um_filter_40_10]PIY74593.1 MAG: hypothetical protein COY85_02790 [Candidatus